MNQLADYRLLQLIILISRIRFEYPVFIYAGSYHWSQNGELNVSHHNDKQKWKDAASTTDAAREFKLQTISKAESTYKTLN